MKKLFLIFITLLTLGAVACDTGQWQTVGPAGFTQDRGTFTDLYVYNGTPYLAFVDGSANFTVSVMKFENNSWNYVGAPGISEKRVTDPYIAVINGTPYVSYGEYYGNRVQVKKFNGTTWETILNDPWGPAAIQEVNGVLYASTSIGIQSYSNGVWTTVAPAPAEGSSNVFTVSFGVPYIAYSQYLAAEGNYKVTVKKYMAGSWQLVGPERFSPGHRVSDINLVVYAGTPYVAFTNFDEPYGYGSYNVIETMVMKFNGFTWAQVGIGSIGDHVYATDTHFTIQNGVPVVVYTDVKDWNYNGQISGKVTAKAYAYGLWQPIGDIGFTELGGYGVSSIFVENTTLYLCYPEGSNGYKATVMKYE